jgi:pimeloyl-ACP methyl ester carboxylesterase
MTAVCMIFLAVAAHAQPAARIEPFGARRAAATQFILVPGLGLSGDAIEPLAAALAASGGVHLVTPGGIGGAPWPATGDARWVDAIAEQIGAYAAAFGETSVIVIGHGIGGTIACTTLGRAHVDGVVTINGPITPAVPGLPDGLGAAARLEWIRANVAEAAKSVPDDRWTASLVEQVSTAAAGLPTAARLTDAVRTAEASVTRRYYVEWLGMDASAAVASRPDRVLAIVPTTDGPAGRDEAAQTAAWRAQLGGDDAGGAAIAVIGDGGFIHLRETKAVSERIVSFANAIASMEQKP